MVAINAVGETPSEPVTLTIATRYTVNNVIYELIDNDMTVVGYEGAFASYTVETTVEGHTVTKIGESAFEGNKNITSISLPNTITIIGKKAFKDCSNLASMDSHN